VDDFFVTAASRRRGVGTDLLGFALERARGRGARLVALTTNERNEAARRLYERSGFRAERERYARGRALWLERKLEEER
jgi:GNAT superfamily N-acetyltransferase